MSKIGDRICFCCKAQFGTCNCNLDFSDLCVLCGKCPVCCHCTFGVRYLGADTPMMESDDNLKNTILTTVPLTRVNGMLPVGVYELSTGKLVCVVYNGRVFS